MTLIKRLEKRAKELDHELIRAIPLSKYDLQMMEDRQLLEDCRRKIEELLAGTRINHPVPGQ